MISTRAMVHVVERQEEIDTKLAETYWRNFCRIYRAFRIEIDPESTVNTTKVSLVGLNQFRIIFCLTLRYVNAIVLLFVRKAGLHFLQCVRGLRSINSAQPVHYTAQLIVSRAPRCNMVSSRAQIGHIQASVLMISTRSMVHAAWATGRDEKATDGWRQVSSCAALGVTVRPAPWWRLTASAAAATAANKAPARHETTAPTRPKC